MTGPAFRRAVCALPALLLAVQAGVQIARAQTAGPSPSPDRMPPQQAMPRPEMDRRAAGRFPQPVRAGSLVGRDLLRPEEAQPVLGRVAGLARRGDGAADLIVRLDGRLGLDRLGLPGIGWAGIGPRLVAVPVEAVALLGEHVALMGLTPEQLGGLPTFAPEAAAAIGPDETLRIGLVRPFH